MKRIIINGANGYVASNFIHELLNRNYEVIALVRESKKCSSTERMQTVLSDVHDGEFIMPENFKVYTYSLLDDNFGLSEEVLKELFSCDVDYYHFAASLKYDYKSKEEIFETNIKGVENSVNIFTKYSNEASRFLFISTAYSCGKIKGIFKEEFYEREDISKFRNYYEQSKRFAENLLKEKMEENDLDLHVIRLSQVVGNNKSGVTKTDYGIFDFAKRVQSLAYRNPNLTARVKVNPEATQNLIPIDTVVSYLMRTVEIQEIPIIMNFIAKNSVKNIHIINSLCKLLPVNLIPTKSIKKVDMSAVERIISIGMSFTGSYVETNLQFDTKNLDKLVLACSCYETNEHAIYKMLKYFLDDLDDKKGNSLYTRAC
ncbi:SDR family oxidoreductase [Ancylomarina longa]|uniref:NAD-dependent epimerase/dehydratase family protein n=1 Tax=Ancylomarina longa TaxID=2487017 RepID=A0A434AG75_9BACT|nr:SDR family oxidoreductase [Ancylomarina longa]RUT73383.1 NAD-dependent epimerase/dehydratase family protein [Ancylomarina longa]